MKFSNFSFAVFDRDLASLSQSYNLKSALDFLVPKLSSKGLEKVENITGNEGKLEKCNYATQIRLLLEQRRSVVGKI